ncbi:hypothetical protein PIB30_040970 [Stylosanthes scabra]|uniref:Uncharacterized protein n=1 Tax=Stylosanthes scabra TaxID=79078 RepID=A0ABU6TGT0_9FABA|nr:hypothetical protein [Stylosanthes scabra]
MDSQSVVSGAQELKRGNLDINTFEKVYNEQEIIIRWIFGKIVAMNSRKTDWYGSTRNALWFGLGDMIWCCNFQRYKEKVVAFDRTCITLLLWDREYKYLCALEDENLDEHPSQLDTLFEMKQLFKVSIKSSNIDEVDLVYPVMKICDDENMIKYQPIEFDTNPCISTLDVRASNFVGVSHPVLNLESDHDTHLNVVD